MHLRNISFTKRSYQLLSVNFSTLWSFMFAGLNLISFFSLFTNTIYSFYLTCRIDLISLPFSILENFHQWIFLYQNSPTLPIFWSIWSLIAILLLISSNTLQLWMSQWLSYLFLKSTEKFLSPETCFSLLV